MIGHFLRLQPSEDPRKALKWLPVGKWEGLDQHRAEWLRRKGMESWGERVGKRLPKLQPTGLSGKDSFKPRVPLRHRWDDVDVNDDDDDDDDDDFLFLLISFYAIRSLVAMKCYLL